MIGRAIPWDELLEHRLVRRLVALMERRFGVGLGFATVDGGPRRAPHTDAARGACPCDAVRASGPAGASCLEAALDAARRVSATGSAEPALARCAAGLGALVAPVTIGGELAGCLLAGGLHLDAAPARGPALGSTELACLAELLTLCADELAAGAAEAGEPAPPPARATRYSYDALIGRSTPMQELYGLLDKVIDSDSTVLIHGENGTGKELIARAIHFNSVRKAHRFVVQNCSAFNDNLLDSELFGHKRGAFTGAIADKQGLFEVADGGTFFLDEIGDMSPALQVKLLRVLQEGTFLPVGDTTPRHVDVRIIAATNRDLRRMVEQGQFREDLYYRVNVIGLVAPPLRERRDDIPLLVEHFLRKHGRARARGRRLTKACLDRLLAHHWPGNVRELENEIERLVVLAGEEKAIGEEHLSARLREAEAGSGAAPGGAGARAAAGARAGAGLPWAVAQLERSMIADTLRRHRGNKTRAARELRVSRRNLIRLVRKYELEDKGRVKD